MWDEIVNASKRGPWCNYTCFTGMGEWYDFHSVCEVILKSMGKII